MVAPASQVTLSLLGSAAGRIVVRGTRMGGGEWLVRLFTPGDSPLPLEVLHGGELGEIRRRLEKAYERAQGGPGPILGLVPLGQELAS